MTTAVLEAYVLAPGTDAKTSVLQGLVEGSEAWYEIVLTEALNAGKVNDPATEDLLVRYRRAFPGEPSAQMQLRASFLRASVFAEGSNEQKESFKVIAQSHLNLQLTHTSAAFDLRGAPGGDDTASRLPSVLPETVLPSKEKVLEMLYQGNLDASHHLPADCLDGLAFDRFKSEHEVFAFLQAHRDDLPALLSNQSLSNRIKSIIEHQISSGGLASKRWLELLSLTLLDDLGKLVPSLFSDMNYVHALIARRFSEALDPDTRHLFTREERRTKLSELLAYVDSLCVGPEQDRTVARSFQLQLLLELLQLHVQLNNCNRELLLRYLREAHQNTSVSAAGPPPQQQRQMKAYQQPQMQQQQQMPQPQMKKASVAQALQSGMPLISGSTPDELGVNQAIMRQPPVQAHLRAFILDDAFVEIAKPFFAHADKEFSRLRDEMTLLSGRQLGHSRADAEWIESLTKRASLNILPHNCECFAPADAVSLSVRLKNLPRLTVHIYEINAESYYLHHQKAFTSDISLDGVGATFEAERLFEHAPIIEHDEQLELPQLTGKQGLFVLDLIGGGLRSRAVIRKGTLSLIHKTTPVGHVAYVLAPDRGVIKEGARLHLDGRWYESDAAKGGRIVIPYGKNTQTLKIIISGAGMAQFSDFQRMRESYGLEAAFLLFKETVVMGKSAKLLVQPKLLCCERMCDFDLVKKAEVTISMRSGQEGVPTVRTFSNFDKRTGFDIDFLVPPRLKSIEAKLSVEVANRSGKDTQSLVASKSWQIEDHAHSFNWFELFLSKTEQGYQLLCLGKDGEPQTGVTCDVYFTALTECQTSLTTDEQGTVQLGALKDVSSITAVAGGLTRSFAIPDEYSIQYPSQLDILEGEELKLPCLASSACLLELSSSGEPVALRNDSVRKEGSLIHIQGLQRGRYHLRIPGVHMIELNVHRGTYWQDGYVLRHDAILENQEKPTILAIIQASVTTGGIAATLTGFRAGTKVHVFGFRFLPSNVLEIVEALRANTLEAGSTCKFPFQMWKNLFQSNIALGGELSYVLRRQREPPQVGNLLKRPRLLLQPEALKDTSFASESLEEAGMLQQMPEMMQMQQQAQMPMMRSMRQAQMPMSEQMKNAPMRMKKKAGGRGGAGGRANVDIQGFQNFLNSEAFVSLNADLGESGLFDVRADLKELSCVLIIAVDQRNVAHRIVPVAKPVAPIVCRSLSLQTTFANSDNSNFFVEKFTAKPLFPDDSFDISDQASAEWRVVDSIERLLSFYRTNHPEMVTPLDTWGLGQWGTFDRAAKVERWSKHSCHEFNLFLFMKDQPFFEEIVKPFLQSKMEAGVVDMFLLNMESELQPMLAPARFQQLNLLEQILVIRTFAASKPEMCQKLAAAIKARTMAKAKHRTGSVKNMLLDSVLSLEPSKGTEEWQMAEEEEEEADGMMMPMMARSAVAAEAYSPPPPPGNYGLGVPAGAGAMFDFESADFSAQQEKKEWADVETTKEYAETQYYGTGQGSTLPATAFGISEFWADTADHAAQVHRGQLLSPNFIFATASVHEVASAVALLNLPFAAESHSLVSKGGLAASFIAASPCVFVAKETVGVPQPEAGSDISVSVRVYKAKLDETTSQDPLAVREFLAGEPYCLQVVVTNVSPKHLEPQVLVQIPQGALPLGSAAYTQAYSQKVSAFACWRIAVHFYFPRPGDFIGAPVYCSVDGKAVATSSSVKYRVVRSLSYNEVESFSDVLRSGEDAVITFLNEADLLGGEKSFTFDQLYPLLKNAPFYLRVLEALRGRGVFERSVWGYGFLHIDTQACRELLAAELGLHKKLGAYFESPLVSVNATEAGLAHLEYYPLVNKRAHQLGEKGGAPPILNRALKKTYEDFVRMLARKGRPLSGHDKLRLSYYMLCQDRVQEGKSLFESSLGDVDSKDMQLQRDYMAAFFDLFDPVGGLSTLRRVVKERSSCLHTVWRELFDDLAQVLAEIDGAGATDVGMASATGVGLQELASTLSMSLQKGTMKIEADGLETLCVKLYRVDLEMLFSRTPFMKPETLRDEFSFIKPIYEESLPGATAEWEIPSNLRRTDLAVELIGGGVSSKSSHRAFEMHFASEMRVAVAEQHGYLVASKDSKPLHAVYVKVFAKQHGGSHTFFKDGYTDLRGRFDYASLSGESAKKVQQFAILASSRDYGGLVREAAPPKPVR